MEIIRTSHYIKEMSKIQNAKALKNILKVEEKIAAAEKFTDLFALLDIKKYDPGLGGYRIRFGNNPEWRIRFDLIDSPTDNTKKAIELQIVLPREKYEKYAHRSVKESVERKLIILVTEEQLNKLMSIETNNVI